MNLLYIDKNKFGGVYMKECPKCKSTNSDDIDVCDVCREWVVLGKKM